ncbi:MAG: phosphoesterase [Paenibacillus sp.]|jgi:histidinol-phosphatase (PHP family)|nr:phosphoesterase [Paenibacillus sp.]
MKFDLHTHHERCGHATGSVEEYIQSAIRAGLDVIGISDHSPFYAMEDDHPSPGSAMAISHFPQYVKEVLQLKEKYEAKIEVLLGVESDYFPKHEALYRRHYSQYPFDYLIGSVHFINGFHLFHKKRWIGGDDRTKSEDKELYYQSIQQSARSGMFDIIGHLDALKGFFPTWNEVHADLPDRTLKVIAECGLAIEVNTSGMRKPCKQWFPADELLERAFYYNIPVTFGSDAHTPEHVGLERELVAKRLKEIGYKEWVFFWRRSRQTVAL